MEIRQIRPYEWELLKQVRLAALTDCPDAFSATLDQERQMPESTWQERALSGADGRDSYCTIAIHDDKPVGIAVGLPDTEDPSRAYLVSMWVAPVHRGTDVASSLLAQVMAWAADQGARVLFAGVRPGNVRAIAFYDKMGFVPYEGVPPDHPATTGCEVVLQSQLRRGSDRVAPGDA
jgi:GNAT superfamily N-acetyltransferase